MYLFSDLCSVHLYLYSYSYGCIVEPYPRSGSGIVTQPNLFFSHDSTIVFVFVSVSLVVFEKLKYCIVEPDPRSDTG